MDNNILIIKFSAIGDFVQATGAFAAIRKAHPKAKITLLTTKPMRTLAEGNPNVDEVIYHVKPKWYELGKMRQLKKQIQGFNRIYDLQCNDRTSLYFRLSGKPSGWCGTAQGAEFWQDPLLRAGRHSGDFFPDQLALAGIKKVPTPDISYAASDATEKLAEKGLLEKGKYPKNLAVLIPGSSAGWTGKRWPHYIELANALQEKGYTVWLCGGPDEVEWLESITAASGAPNMLGLSLAQCLSVFKKAKLVIGNDTGPMHMAAAVGATGTVLFGPSSDYTRHAPRSPKVTVLNNPNDIGDLTLSEVLATVEG